MIKSKAHSIYEEIMVELYKNATPSADFKELVKNAEIGKNGEKIIEFNSYEIEEKLAISIFDAAMKKHKVAKHARDVFSFQIWLGCSPRFKKKKN